MIFLKIQSGLASGLSRILETLIFDLEGDDDLVLLQRHLDHVSLICGSSSLWMIFPQTPGPGVLEAWRLQSRL